MFVEEVRRAITATPREKLVSLSAAVWKAYAGGAIGEGEAQQLADEIEGRKTAPPPPAAASQRPGSRPRTAASLERRRRWVAAGFMPPQIAAQFTMGEAAVLAVITLEVGKRGLCRLTLNHIAALAGVCRSTVRNAVRQAVLLGLVKNEEWRLTAFRNAPNTVTIVSVEWLAWLRHRSRVGGRKTVDPTDTRISGTLRPSRPDQEPSVRYWQKAGRMFNPLGYEKPRMRT